MRHFLPLKRLASHAAWNHDAEGFGRRRSSQPDPAAAEGGFPPQPGGNPGGLGHSAKSAPFGCERSFPRSRQRDFAAVSGCFSARFIRELFGAVRELMRSLLLVLIRAYRVFISPALPSACRFYPTCSAYAYEAVEKWGAWRGSWLALRRIARCHPLGGHGLDPVPGKSKT